MTIHALVVMAIGFGLIAATLTFAYHATRFLAYLEARGQAFDDDLAAELLARAQSRHIEAEWARLDEESS